MSSRLGALLLHYPQAAKWANASAFPAVETPVAEVPGVAGERDGR